MTSSRREQALRLVGKLVADEIWRTEIEMGDETEAFQRLQAFLTGLSAGPVSHELHARLREYGTRQVNRPPATNVLHIPEALWAAPVGLLDGAPRIKVEAMARQCS